MDSSQGWAVVYVWRGIPDRVELFRDERSAYSRADELNEGISLEDEISVIKLEIPSV